MKGSLQSIQLTSSRLGHVGGQRDILTGAYPNLDICVSEADSA